MNLTKKEAARLGLLKDSEPAPQKGKVRRAPTEPPTGLTTLILVGWSVSSPDSVRYRLRKGDLDTGLCDSEQAACDKAKALLL